jgi:hypothetical protein
LKKFIPQFWQPLKKQESREFTFLAKTAAVVILSYGIKTFPRVKVITGIGDLEVTLAKKQFMER